jgi:hypothetical protein
MGNIIVDKGLELAARVWFRERVGRYAELKTISVNTKAKRLRVVVSPRGDPAEIGIDVTDYEVTRERDGSYVMFKDLECSRTWVQLLLDDHLRGKRLPVPTALAGFL